VVLKPYRETGSLCFFDKISGFESYWTIFFLLGSPMQGRDLKRPSPEVVMVTIFFKESCCLVFSLISRYPFLFTRICIYSTKVLNDMEFRISHQINSSSIQIEILLKSR
jgi:hypothetical protein